MKGCGGAGVLRKGPRENGGCSLKAGLGFCYVEIVAFRNVGPLFPILCFSSLKS